MASAAFMRRHLPRLAAALTAVLLAADCTGEASSGGTPSPGSTQGALNVFPASFDLSVGDDQRFLAGPLTNDRSLIVGGQIDMSFFYFGEQPDPANRILVAETTASYLPVPGNDELTVDGGPIVAEASSATGVYETTVTFDRPGTWGAGITATIDGETRRGTGTSPWGPNLRSWPSASPHRAPTTPPLRTTSRLLPSTRGPRPSTAGRSRTPPCTTPPSPRPSKVSIPSSWWCPPPSTARVASAVPTTETVHDLADSYGEQAEFVHLEVWGDFENQELNGAAAEWIQTEEGGNEPWVFLVDADGNLAARGDNVLDLEALEAELDALPAASDR